ncbi:YciI family protein [Streptomyces sp. NPDC005899]|uniref:YciI family protein n=1 Tax=Streptomyces sp. NPDC005899 TaxID=3155716 RepID=UPI0033F0FB6D
MKYLVMVQGSQADYEAMAGTASPAGPAWNEEDMRAMFAFMKAVNDDLTESGELVDANGLAEPARTRFVGAGQDGRPVVSDDPHGRTEVVLAGYWVLACESLERVTEIAARIATCPQPAGAPDHPVVIRQIMGEGAGESAG